MRDFEYCHITVACLRFNMMHGMSMVSPKRTVYWGTSFAFAFVLVFISFSNEYLESWWSKWWCCCWWYCWYLWCSCFIWVFFSSSSRLYTMPLVCSLCWDRVAAFWRRSMRQFICVRGCDVRQTSKIFREGKLIDLMKLRE